MDMGGSNSMVCMGVLYNTTMPADYNEQGIDPDWQQDEDVQAFLEDPAHNKEPHEMGDMHEYIQGGLTGTKSKQDEK